MSSQTLEKEKVRLTLEAAEIPEKEIEDLISETSGLWAPAKDGNLAYIPIKLLERICPTFLFNLKSKLETEVPDRVNKKVSFTLKVKDVSYLFGLNETDRDGKAQDETKQTVWRVKQNPNSGQGFSAGGGKGGMAPQPLAELFIGTIEECNQKLKDESKRWYLAEQKIFLNDVDGFKAPLGYAILKRNRYNPPPVQAPTTSS